MEEIIVTKELLESFISTSISYGSACGFMFGILFVICIYFGIGFISDIIEKYKNKRADKK